jgi:GAF domain-containing protein
VAKRGQALSKARAAKTPAKPAFDLKQENAALKRDLRERDAELGRRAVALRKSDEELREALAQQAAIAEMLQIINRSSGDAAPVFDAILERAMRLCDAAFGGLLVLDGEFIKYLALHNVPERFTNFLTHNRVRPRTMFGPGWETGAVFNIADLSLSEAYGRRVPLAVSAVKDGGIRSMMLVPIMKDGAFIGAFTIYRQEVRPFTDRQIALGRSFADQAAIAMENARLINELRDRTHDLEESLEYQTATGDVLKAISRSTFDLHPVLDTVCDTARRLCGAALAGIAVRRGDVYRYIATSSDNPAWDAKLRETDWSPGRDSIAGRASLERQVVHVENLAADLEYVDRMPDAVSGARTAIGVPLLCGGEPIGVIFLGHEHVQPFTERQIELVRTFADQAVIAIENTRLLTETREALEQRTATAEVLGVINSSPGNLGPVFNAILEKAHRLCGVGRGALLVFDGEFARAVATHGIEEAQAVRLRQPFRPLLTNSPHARVAREKRVVHIPDLAADALWEPDDPKHIGAGRAGVGTMLFVPLCRDDTVLGWISANRLEVRPFTDKQIALLQNFAAQAVIAMENARLLTETREALDQQTVTAEVLQVINASPGDLKPVFEAMLDKALRLCDASFGTMQRNEGNHFHMLACRNVPPPFEDFLMRPMQALMGGALDRLLRGEVFVQIIDVRDGDLSTSGRRALVELAQARTVLWIPLRKESAVLGAFVIYRQQVKPFADKQIALLQNFASQAVIAMENARLFEELRQSLAQQTATTEVLQIINTSQGELKPVFNAILDNALRLSQSAFGTLRIWDGTRFYLGAQKNVPQAHLDFSAKRMTTLTGIDALGPRAARVLTEKCVLQIVDAKDTDAYRSGVDPMARAIVDLAGARTMMFVPLLSGDVARGTIMVFRTEVRPYSDKEIALLQNFAAQAVIAMDNARLLGELRERQAELRVTFDNMGDGVALFDAEPRLVAWNRNFQNILDLPDALLAQRLTYVEYIKMLADRGEFGTLDNIEAELARRMETLDRPALFARTRPDGKVIEARRNPVPGGGFVLIYSDITERKRAEAEISAARDAAETALAELKAAQANLIQAEKMASLGQLTAGIAHEIKNPLNFVNNFAGLSNELLGELKEISGPALETLGEDRRAELNEVLGMLSGNLGKIVEHGRRADGIVKSMLAHSRGGSGDRQTVDLNALVEESLNLAYHGARAQDQNFNVTMERELDPTMKPVELVPQDITRVFLNLFGNGFYAANKRSRAIGDGAFRPVLRVATRDADDAVEVKVRDNGIGVPPNIKDKLFQPFFTTKPTGEGTGLGLSISYDIVTQQHGGTISVDSEEGVFTEFTVRLPRGWRAPPPRGAR